MPCVLVYIVHMPEDMLEASISQPTFEAGHRGLRQDQGSQAASQGLTAPGGTIHHQLEVAQLEKAANLTMQNAL